MTAKRFTIENDIEMKDNWNINKRCYHFGNGFDAKDCCNMLNELAEENKELKEKNKFILGQIRAFRDDCYTFLDFDGASTLNRLLDILGEER